MNYFYIENGQRITLPKAAKTPFVEELLSGYTPGIEWDISYSEGTDVFEITVGRGEKIGLGEGDYAVNVTEKGVFLCGADHAGTMRGLFTFLEMIFCYGKLDYRAECGEIREKADIGFRGVHLCLFPEYSFEDIRRVIRTCAIAKYTHVFLETWGAVKLDTLRELSWENALTKDEIRQIVREANALGLAIVPFFQHLGHASLARLGYSGKHTLLDQDPCLEYLYYPKSYGWVWNFNSPETRELLSGVREELMELFGNSGYFHLGCDEAGIEFDAEELCDYLNEVSASLKAKGRQAIIWGDMLLCKRFFEPKAGEERKNGCNVYECNSSAEYAAALIERLDKDIIIADWQYNAVESPWKSADFFAKNGFDVLLCPWEEDADLNSAFEAAKEGKHLGVLKTTWNRLFAPRGIPSVVYFGLLTCGDKSFTRFAGRVGNMAERSHAIYRKVKGKSKADVYKNAGWSEKQV